MFFISALDMGFLHLVDTSSKSDEKILIKCKTGEQEKASQNMYVFSYLYPLPNVILKGKKTNLWILNI